MTLRIKDIRGSCDGIRWGHAVSPDAPTDSHHFMWTYDVLNDRARVFRSADGDQKLAEEFGDQALAAQVRDAVSRLLSSGRGEAA